MTRWALIGITALGLSGLLATVKLDPVETGAAMATDSIERGRYLVKIGGCNDCHTPNYLEKAGNVPEDRWLIGDSLGFNGPWGTTYPTNLRQLLRTMGEDDWVRSARTVETRPPMPWFNLRAMTDADLRAIHRYVLSLPADDTPVPDYVPPDRPPKTPHIVFVPQPSRP
ncbi:MAG: cytochrome C [Mesorhizobium sp.]|jgi:mono/diheme cytochrome c family protein|uniref:c-type cytochrome n=2 Tax=Phyllobacteriaceae TaxID=69277 RepID=UPI000FE99EE9|nr:MULTISPECIES: cytochrome c [Mesorhizobium]MCF6111064.1 cytochrome c [Mesorhizobium muleiense]RWB04098.1 MAG: cytochrome C [Mesorhizobium sp.]RWO09081.1 MAG: cytochrome C [Mesorhizobium sp.]RWQ60227.1 MAG: cytochrome C [Mesorhizobium sp.]